MHGAVGANTNSSHTKCTGEQRILPKVVLTFECSNGETIYMFICIYNLPREA